MQPPRVSRMLLTGTLALLAALGTAPTVSAECDPSSLPSRDVADYRGLLFRATVTSISEQPTRRPLAGTDYDTEMTLDVGRVYRGEIADPFLVNGWDAGCGLLRIRGLRVGDTLFVSIGGADSISDPTIGGPILIWHRVDGRWRFDEQALQYANNDPNSYPPAARQATTTAEILSLVGPGTGPDTAVAQTAGTPPRTPLTTPPYAILLIASAFGAVASLYRTRSARR